MKRLGMLLVLVSVGMFTLAGCGDTKKTTPKKEEPKTETTQTPAGDAPAAPAAPADPAKEAPK